MRIALCTCVCQDAPIDETIRLAKLLGLDGLVLTAREPNLPESYDPVRLGIVRRLVGRHALTVAAYRSQFRAGAEAPGPMRADEASQAVRAALSLDAGALTVRAGLTSRHEEDHDALQHAVKELREVCAMAEEHGLRVAVEMAGGTCAAEADAALSLLERVGAPNLGLAWEPGDGERFSACLERLRAIAAHALLVFAENRAHGGAGYSPFVPLSTGALDYRDVFACLNGFAGWVVLTAPIGPPEERPRLLSEDIAFLRRLDDPRADLADGQ